MDGPREHHYRVEVAWSAPPGGGTIDYRAYSRDHRAQAEGKSAAIAMSSGLAPRGNPGYYNPEELLIAALASCHMLWMLHLCAANHITVVDYRDAATGVLAEEGLRGGRVTAVTLHPVLRVLGSARIDEVRALHDRAHHLCFIANSVNFPVTVEPVVETSPADRSSPATGAATEGL